MTAEDTNEWKRGEKEEVEGSPEKEHKDKGGGKCRGKGGNFVGTLQGNGLPELPPGGISTDGEEVVIPSNP